MSPEGTVSFLLSKVGFAAAAGFAEAIAPLGIEPRHAGLLRAVAANEGLSQQALGQAIGVAPSRIVALVDELEHHGLVERRLNPKDRRAREIHLTDEGRATLAAVTAAGLAHEERLCVDLTAAERVELHGLLLRLAETLDVPLAIHPALGRD
jgi:DNA-binding MarR family transcriptional regulator